MERHTKTIDTTLQQQQRTTQRQELVELNEQQQLQQNKIREPKNN